MPVLEPPKWSEIAGSAEWQSATPDKRDSVRSQWLMDMRDFQKAGYIDGTPADLMNAARESGVFETAGVKTADVLRSLIPQANASPSPETQAIPDFDPAYVPQKPLPFGVGPAQTELRNPTTGQTPVSPDLQRAIETQAGSRGADALIAEIRRQKVAQGQTVGPVEASIRPGMQALANMATFGVVSPQGDAALEAEGIAREYPISNEISGIAGSLLGLAGGGAMPAGKAVYDAAGKLVKTGTMPAAIAMSRLPGEKIAKAATKALGDKLQNATVKQVAEGIASNAVNFPIFSTAYREVAGQPTDINSLIEDERNAMIWALAIPAMRAVPFRQAVEMYKEAKADISIGNRGEFPVLRQAISGEIPLVKRTRDVAEVPQPGIKPEQKPQSDFVKRGTMLAESPKVEMTINEGEVPVEPLGVNTVAKFREQQGQAKAGISPRDMADEMYANQREYGIWDDAGMLDALKKLETSEDPFDRQVYGELVNRILPDKRLASLQRLNAKKFMEAQPKQPEAAGKQPIPVGNELVDKTEPIPPPTVDEPIIGQYIHNPAPGKARIATKMVSPGTVTNAPTPEPANVIAEQVRLTADPKSTKAVTLVTPGEAKPEIPPFLETVETTQGTAIYNPAKTTKESVVKAAMGEQFNGKLLGMSESQGKPSEIAVTTSTPAANDVIAATVRPTLAEVAKEVKAQKAAVPGGKVEVKKAADVVEGRGEKQPWEMTKAEYTADSINSIGFVDKGRTGFSKTSANRSHEKLVKQALTEGKPVPAAVLADYPDIATPTRSQQAAGIRKTLREVAGEKVVATPSPVSRDTQLLSMKPDELLNEWFAGKHYGAWFEAWNRTVSSKNAMPIDEINRLQKRLVDEAKPGKQAVGAERLWKELQEKKVYQESHDINPTSPTPTLREIADASKGQVIIGRVKPVEQPLPATPTKRRAQTNMSNPLKSWVMEQGGLAHYRKGADGRIPEFDENKKLVSLLRTGGHTLDKLTDMAIRDGNLGVPPNTSANEFRDMLMGIRKVKTGTKKDIDSYAEQEVKEQERIEREDAEANRTDVPDDADMSWEFGGKAEKPAPTIEEMTKEALRWQGAHMNAETEYMNRGDKSGVFALAKESGKSFLDDYLIKKFGIERDVAHTVANGITQRNLDPIRTAQPDEFVGESWADKTIADRKQEQRKNGDSLFVESDMPFNLVEQSTGNTKPKGKAINLSTEGQPALFDIQEVVKEVDPELSANAAQEHYGTPQKAIDGIRRQLDAVNANPDAKKAFGKEQRGRLSEVLRLLEQRRDDGGDGAGMVELGVDMRPPSRPPLDTKLVKITSNPQKLNAFVDAIGRLFMAGKRVGGRSKEQNTIDFMRQGAMEADRGEVSDFIKGFKKDLRKAEQDSGYLRKDIRASLEKLLKGEIEPGKVLGAGKPGVDKAIASVIKARTAMDAMSRRIADIMGIEAGNEALQATIEAHEGKYVVRTYKKFTPGGYSPTKPEAKAAHDFFADQLDGIIAGTEESISGRIDKAKKDADKEAIKNFVVSGDYADIEGTPKYVTKLAERSRAVYLSLKADFAEMPTAEIGDAGEIKVSLTPDQREQIVQGQMEYLLKKDTDYGAVFGNTGSAAWKQFQKSFIARKDIPVELRNFMGEVHDLPAMIQMTMTRQRQILTSNHFQKQLISLNDKLPDADKFYSVIPLPGKTEKIEGKAFGPLTDYGRRAIFADKPTADMLRNLDPAAAMENPLMRAWMKGLSITRFTKTVANVPGYFERNFISNWFPAFSGGEPVAHPVEFSKGMAKAIKVYQTNQKEFYRLMRLSLISSSAHGAELKQTYTEGFGSNTEITPETMFQYVANARNRVAGGLTAASAWGDNVWKMADFYSRTSRGISEAEAVKQIREIYPYYDEAADVVTKVLRRAPVVGDFITFPAEIMRTQVNSWINAASAMADGKRPMVDRIAPSVGVIVAQGLGTVIGMNLFASLYANIQNAVTGGQLSGIDRDKEEAARTLLPSYQEGNSILWLKGKNGNTYFTDFGYIQPYDLTGKMSIILGSNLTAAEKGKKFISMFSGLAGSPMFAERLAELKMNVDKNGNQIYSKENSLLAFRQITAYLWKTQAPSNVVSLENMLRVMSAKKPISTNAGDVMTVSGEFAKMVTPVRVKMFDPKLALQSRLYELKSAMDEAKKPANRAFRQQQLGRGTQENFQQQQAISQQELSTWAKDRMNSYIKAAKDYGLSQAEIYQSMKAVGFSNLDIYQSRQESGPMYRPPQGKRQ